MPFRFIEDIAIADIAFEAEGKTLAELFESAGLAVESTMTGNPGRLRQDCVRKFEVTAESVEMLLYHFLQELVFLKDAAQLLFGRFSLHIGQREGRWHLDAEAIGDIIDPDRHELLADVKAVSLHDYRVRQTPEGWHAHVILDV